MPTYKPKSRLTLAVAGLAVLAGTTLLAIEVVRLIGGQGVGSWFWIIIAALAVLFGVYEFFAPPEEEHPGRARD